MGRAERIVLCVDVGSTFTKGALVEAGGGDLLAVAAHPTTLGTDVLDGVHAVRAAVEAEAGVRAGEVRACSSAGGGLRVAVVGAERLVTAEAGHRVALTAGGRVVHVHAGPLDGPSLSALRAARPDVVLLTGGTDGGNADVVLHNAGRLARARIGVPVVYAGNADAAEPASEALARTGRRVTVAANVLPRIGVLEPAAARVAIRAVFLEHVIGGKRLSRGPAFGRMLRGATPDVVLAGVELLADGAPGVPGAGDVVVVDVGGATTDVYSVIRPAGEDAALRREVVAPLWRARSVEGDLGLRWNAPGVLAAARAERLLPAESPAPAAPAALAAPVAPAADDALDAYARRCAADPGQVPASAGEAGADARIAELAVTIALRRHARPASPSAAARPLRDVGLVVGSGGVLRHGDDALRRRVLAPAIGDLAGGWKVPEHARLAVDARYVLFAAGLLAAEAPVAAAQLITRNLTLLPA
jgi:uncharacterized protein (TIGR01319 family)